MQLWARTCAVVTLVLLAAACGPKKQIVTVTIPPRLDLTQHKRAALTTFTVQNAKGSLHELATRRFAEAALHAQSVEILEVGEVSPVLQQVGENAFGPAAAQAYGSSHDVPVVFAGHLKVSNARPSGGLSGLTMPHFEATISVELSVALYSTRSGGTLWRSGAEAADKVGQLSFNGVEPTFSAKDPNAAYGQLVDRLVAVVSRDMYPTYERR
jgi:hypothetical protein